MPCEWIRVRGCRRIRAFLIPTSVPSFFADAHGSMKLEASKFDAVRYFCDSCEIFTGKCGRTGRKNVAADDVVCAVCKVMVASSPPVSQRAVGLSSRLANVNILASSPLAATAGCFIRSILEKICTLRRWSCASLYCDYNRKSPVRILKRIFRGL